MIERLPFLEACCNGVALFCMTAGYLAVKKRRILLHKSLMTAAVSFSIVFLALYLVYHFNAEPKSYTGSMSGLYYTILVSHVFLAALVPFMVGYVVVQAWRGNLVRHRSFARKTLPIWAYVSVTGILIYWFVHVP